MSLFKLQTQAPVSVDPKVFLGAKTYNNNGVIYLGDPNKPGAQLLGYADYEALVRGVNEIQGYQVVLPGTRIENALVVRCAGKMLGFLLARPDYAKQFQGESGNHGVISYGLPFDPVVYQGVRYAFLSSSPKPVISYPHALSGAKY